MNGRTKTRALTSSAPMICVLASALLAASCGPAATGPGAVGQSGDTRAGACQQELDPSPPKALGVPRTSIGASLAVSEAMLLARLSEEVPTTVAKAKNQSIGAAGRVTYTITRTPFELSTSKAAIILGTHLKGDIEVCKPIGPFCPDYGKCKPGWDVEITLSTNFEDGPELEARTRVELSKGCVLQPVGFNATHELEKITRDEARKVRDRINGELSRINQRIAREWRQFARPHQWKGGCVQWHTDSARYTLPVSEGGVLRAAFQVEGWVDRNCSLADADANDDSDVPFPKFDAVAALEPKVDFATDTPWLLSDVERAASDALKRPIQLAISGGGADAAAPNRLWLKQASPSCSGWIQITPRSEQGKLYFEAIAPDSAIDPELRKLRLPIPAPHDELSQNARNIDNERKRLQQEARENGLEATLVAEPEELVRIGEGELLLGVRVRGSATLSELRAD